jgi:hypothetical protein
LIAWPFLSFRTNLSVSSHIDGLWNLLIDAPAHCRFQACR